MFAVAAAHLVVDHSTSSKMALSFLEAIASLHPLAWPKGLTLAGHPIGSRSDRGPGDLESKDAGCYDGSG